ncbi:hypothetical protein [Roseovarius sp.]|uniref:hypothetical protein n=1 Tax=Roseovarius sp. TaxID=1486281 RepID=UPI003515EC6B
MIYRRPLGLLAVLALAACSPAIPDSGAPDPGAGVGFNDYDSYAAQRARDAQLAGGVVPAAPVVSSERLPQADASTASASTGSAEGDIASETMAALGAGESRAAAVNSGVVPLEASPSNPPPQTVENAAGISQENDFNAVGAERSIEGDKARIEANRAQYQVVEPTAIPARTGGSEPNIVAYALAASHPVGTQVHRRLNINAGNRYAKNCAKYPSPDKAQEDFLAQGGPERDRMGLDPDGDGFACSWDPAPFRKAVGG